MEDHFGIAGRLEDRAALYEVAAQPARVRDIAVVRDGEAAGRQVGIERLDVAQRGLARGRIADVPARDLTAQARHDLVAVEIARHMPHRAMAVEMLAVPAGNAGGFLSAMLQRVQPERDERGGPVRAGHTEDAALLAQLVVVERIGGQHRRARRCWRVGHIGRPRRFVALL